MMKFKVIFENRDLLVVDKPSGLTVNRSETSKEETLQDQLAEYFGLSDGNLGIGERVGIVHRLDRETSGVLVVAKTQKAFENLQRQFKNRLIKKEYVALVHGRMTDDFGVVKSRIGRIGKFGKFGNLKNREVGGREAETEYKLVSSFKFPISKLEEIAVEKGYNKSRVRYLDQHALEYSLLAVFPKTGRTHQIRVHLKSIGHPVVSDLIYCPSKLLKFDLVWCPRLFLHAKSISFADPKSKKALAFESDLPNELKNAMLLLTTKV